MWKLSVTGYEMKTTEGTNALNAGFSYYYEMVWCISSYNSDDSCHQVPRKISSHFLFALMIKEYCKKSFPAN